MFLLNPCPLNWPLAWNLQGTRAWKTMVVQIPHNHRHLIYRWYFKNRHYYNLYKMHPFNKCIHSCNHYRNPDLAYFHPPPKFPCDLLQSIPTPNPWTIPIDICVPIDWSCILEFRITVFTLGVWFLPFSMLILQSIYAFAYISSAFYLVPRGLPFY